MKRRRYTENEIELVHPRMQKFLLKHGVLRSTLIVTVGAALFALMISGGLILIYRAYGIETDAVLMMTIASLATLLLTFPVSLFAIDMYFRIHKLATDLRYLATYDTLTDLMGRRAFIDETKALIDASARNGESVSLMLCDLDNFKKINDRYGHAAGDRVLQNFAEILHAALPPKAFAGRLGGEEFAVALPHTNRPNALAFSKKIHEMIHKTRVHFQDQTIRYTISAGLVLIPAGQYDNLDDLLHQADIALYAAKKNGKDQTFLFEESATLSKV